MHKPPEILLLLCLTHSLCLTLSSASYLQLQADRMLHRKYQYSALTKGSVPFNYDTIEHIRTQSLAKNQATCCHRQRLHIPII